MCEWWCPLGTPCGRAVAVLGHILAETLNELNLVKSQGPAAFPPVSTLLFGWQKQEDRQRGCVPHCIVTCACHVLGARFVIVP